MAEHKKEFAKLYSGRGLGFSASFRPQGRSEEMLTVVDKPIIQYVVDEALEAGIEHFVFVTDRNKRIIEDYFDIHFELEPRRCASVLKNAITLLARPASQGRYRQLHPPAGTARSRSRHVGAPRQDHRQRTLRAASSRHDRGRAKARGLHEGHDRPLRPERRQHHRRRGTPDQRPSMASSASATLIGDGFRITDMVENPPRERRRRTSSSTATISCSPRCSRSWKPRNAARTADQLTDGMLKLLKDQSFAGYHFKGTTYDCGAKDGFILASVAFALEARWISARP